MFVLLSAVAIGAAVPDSEKRSSHTHLAEQAALISAWKLENYDPHNYDTAVLHQNYWDYHNGTYGGAIVGVDDISKETDDVGYIANMNDEQPVGVFNSVNVKDAIEAGVDKLNLHKRVCCSVNICCKEIIAIYL